MADLCWTVNFARKRIVGKSIVVNMFPVANLSFVIIEDLEKTA